MNKLNSKVLFSLGLGLLMVTSNIPVGNAAPVADKSTSKPLVATSPMQKLSTSIALDANNAAGKGKTTITMVIASAAKLSNTKLAGFKSGQMSETLFYVATFDKKMADVCGVGISNDKAIVPLVECKFEPVAQYEAEAVAVINKTAFTVVRQIAVNIAKNANSLGVKKKETKIADLITASKSGPVVSGIAINNDGKVVTVSAKGAKDVVSCNILISKKSAVISGKTLTGMDCLTGLTAK